MNDFELTTYYTKRCCWQLCSLCTHRSHVPGTPCPPSTQTKGTILVSTGACAPHTHTATTVTSGTRGVSHHYRHYQLVAEPTTIGTARKLPWCRLVLQAQQRLQHSYQLSMLPAAATTSHQYHRSRAPNNGARCCLLEISRQGNSSPIPQLPQLKTLTHLSHSTQRCGCTCACCCGASVAGRSKLLLNLLQPVAPAAYLVKHPRTLPMLPPLLNPSIAPMVHGVCLPGRLLPPCWPRREDTSSDAQSNTGELRGQLNHAAAAAAAAVASQGPSSGVGRLGWFAAPGGCWLCPPPPGQKAHSRGGGSHKWRKGVSPAPLCCC